MKTNFARRWLAIVTAFLMLINMMPVAAFADSSAVVGNTGAELVDQSDWPLDGKSFQLIIKDNHKIYYLVSLQTTASVKDKNKLGGLTLVEDGDGLYRAKSDNERNTDIAVWTFEADQTQPGYYYVKSDGKYLNVPSRAGNVTVSDNKQAIYAYIPESGTFAGRVRLQYSNASSSQVVNNYDHTPEGKFGTWTPEEQANVYFYMAAPVYRTVTVNYPAESGETAETFTRRYGHDIGDISSYIKYIPGYNFSCVKVGENTYTAEQAENIQVALLEDQSIELVYEKDTLGGKSGVLAVSTKGYYAALQAESAGTNMLLAIQGLKDGDTLYTKDDATHWMFKQTGDRTYSIQADNGKYLSITGTGANGSGTLSLTDTAANIVVEQSGESLHLTSGEGAAIDLYGNNIARNFGIWNGKITDSNECFVLYTGAQEKTSWTEDLDGKQFAIGWADGKGNAYVLQDTELNDTKLVSKETLINTDGSIFAMDGAETVWTFHAAHEGNEFKYTIEGPNNTYLTLAAGSLTTGTEPFVFTVEHVEGEGYVFLTDSGYAVRYTGNVNNGYHSDKYNTGNYNEKLYLYPVSYSLPEGFRDLSNGQFVIGMPNSGKGEVYVLQDSQLNSVNLEAVTASDNGDGTVFVLDGSETVWTFTRQAENDWAHYTVSSPAGYLTLASGSLTVGTEPFVFTVLQSKGEDFIVLTDSGYAVRFSGNVKNGYYRDTYNTWNGNEKLYLYQASYELPEGVLDLNNAEGALGIQKKVTTILLQAEAHTKYTGRLAAIETNIVDGAVSANGAAMTKWTFTRVRDNDYSTYYVKADNGLYLNIAADGITVSETAAEIKVEQYKQNDGSIALRLCADGWAVNLYGNNVINGFGPYDKGSDKGEKFLLYPITNEETVRLTLDKNGGSADVDAIICKTGEKVILPDYEGTREGYTFLGWAVKSSLIETYVDISSAVELLKVGEEFEMGGENVTLYAAWTSNTYATAQFYIRLDGGIPPEPADYKNVLYVPLNNGSQPEAMNAMTKESAVKEQRWIIDTGRDGEVVEGTNYMKNNVTAALAEGTLPSNEDIKLAVPDFDPDTQYVLWYVQKWMNAWHVDGVILSRNLVNLTYDPNCTTGSVGNMPTGYQRDKGTEITIGQSVDGTMMEPTRPGYHFLGWSTDPAGRENLYHNNDLYVLNESTTLYAQWADGVNTLSVTKTNEDGVVLEGARFTLTEKVGDGFRQMGESLTDVTGLLTYNYLNYNTVYCLTETAGPAGYETRNAFCFMISRNEETDQISFVICDEDGKEAATPDWLILDYSTPDAGSGDGAVQASLRMKDEWTFRQVRFVVEDDTTHEALAGAAYTLSLDSAAVENVLTDLSADDGVFSVDGAELHMGTYTLTETEAPSSYRKADPVSIEVAGDGTMTVDGQVITPETTTVVEGGMTITTMVYTVTVANKRMVQISGQKVWEDEQNRDGLRPESIVVQLKNGSEVLAEKTLSETDSTWGFDFGSRPYYDAAGNVINYTVDEVDGNWSASYTKTVSGYTITNTHEIGTRVIRGTKVWDDADNQDGKRPASITLTLKNGETEIETITVTADQDETPNEWSFAFETAVPVNADGQVGQEIEYTVTEETINGYDYSYNWNKGNPIVTNTHIPELIDVTITKVWDDGNNCDAVRPDHIVVKLFKNADSKPAATASVTAGEIKTAIDSTWTYTFQNVPKYENGVEIDYSLFEEKVEGYTATYEGKTIHNTYVPETVDVTINKIWVGDDTAERPDSITVYLYADGVKTQTVTLTGEDGNTWSRTIEKLRKNRNVDGKAVPIVYTVSEEADDRYVTAITGSDNAYDITNTRKAVTITANSAEKVYDGTALEEDGYTATALTGGDTIASVNVAGSLTDVGETANVASGATIVNANGENVTASYAITYVDGTLKVTPKAATITVNDAGKTYGESDPEFTGSVEGLINDSDLGEITYTRTNDDQNAGAYSEVLTAGYTANANYTVTVVKGDFNITRKAVTVTAENKEKVYGDTDPQLTWTVEGLVNEEDKALLTVDIVRAAGENVGDYGITVSGEQEQGNYEVTYVNGKLTVTMANATVTADAKSKVYGDDDPELTAVVSGLKNGDTAEVITYAVDRAAGENVGVYTITPAGDAVQGNYNVFYAPSDLTVTARKVVMTSASDSKVYDGTALTNGTVAVTGEGFAYNEGADFNVIGTQTETGTSDNTFTYTLTNGAEAGNYDITTVEGKLTVTEVTDQVVVTIRGHKATNDYDGQAHAVNGYEVEISNPLYTEADFTFEGTAAAARTAEGTTYMGLKAAQFSNTNLNFSDVTFSVEDGWQKIDPISVTVTITEKSGTADYDGRIHTVSGYDVAISNPLYTENDFTFNGPDGVETVSGTDAGTYKMNLRSADFTNTNTNFKNVKFIIVDGELVIRPITAEVTITGASNTAAYDAQEHSVTGYTVEKISTSLYKEADFTFSGTAAAARTEEGTTMMNLTADQFANTNTNFSTVTFLVEDGWQKITPVDEVVVTITGHTATTDYDGDAHTVNGYDVEISNPLYTEADFTFDGTAEAERTDAGTTYMGLAEDQFTNNSANFEKVTFFVKDGWQKIEPIDVTVAIAGHTATADYNGEAHEVTGYDVTYISSPLYTEDDFTFTGAASAERTATGTAKMGLTEDQFTNVNENFAVVTFEITDGWQKVNPVPVTVTITGHTGTAAYDGTAHTTSGYDVAISNPLYTEADFAFAGQAEAKRTNAGTTNMGLTAAAFANTNDNFGPVTFNITDGWQKVEPIDVTVTITENSALATYDGAAHSVSGYTAEADSELYDVKNDFTFSGTAVAGGTEAGTYPMELKAEDFENTNGNFANVTFKIVDGALVIAPITTEVVVNGAYNVAVFDGTEHVVDGYTAEADNPLYDTEEDVDFTGEAEAKRTEEGIEDMNLEADQFSNTNPNFTDVTFIVHDGYQQVTPVDEVVVTITGHTATDDYDGEAHEVAGYDIEINNPLYTADDFTFTGTAAAGRTEAGTTAMGLAAEQFSNTNDNFSKVTFVVKDGWQKINPVNVTVTITGSVAEEDYDGTEHSVEGYTAAADNKLYDVTKDFTFSGTAEAVRTNAGTVPMNLSDSQFTNTNPNFGTVTFIIVDGGLTVNPVEARVVITGNNSTVTYDGAEKTVTGYTVSTDSALYTEEDFTFSGDALAKGTDAGSYPMDLKAEDFANTNSNFINVTFEVTDGTLTVEPAEITVITGGAEKNYDGEALISGEVRAEGLADGDSVQLTATGTQTEVGSSYNTYSLIWDNAKESNYIVKDRLGILTVNPMVNPLFDISGTKTWEDQNNADGLRPESITVNLLADDQKIASQEVTAESGWTYTFANLPTYVNNRTIEYSITEDEVAGYTTTVDGYNLINTHARRQVTISGTKTWVDDENAAGDRPEAITVNLLADGVQVRTMEVTGEGSIWNYSFTDLPRYENGREIVYTVTENEVEGYDASVVGYNLYNVRQTEESQTYTLTVHYWVNGEKAFEDSRHTYPYGAAYSVTSPVKAGYTADKTSVQGVIYEDTEVDVYYTPVTVTLTVYYRYLDGTSAAATYKETLTSGETYSVTSPEIAGYEPNTTVVSGTAYAQNIEAVVIYAARDTDNTRVDPKTPKPGKVYTVIGEYETALGIGTAFMSQGDSIY